MLQSMTTSQLSLPSVNMAAIWMWISGRVGHSSAHASTFPALQTNCPSSFADSKLTEEVYLLRLLVQVFAESMQRLSP